MATPLAPAPDPQDSKEALTLIVIEVLYSANSHKNNH